MAKSYLHGPDRASQAGRSESTGHWHCVLSGWGRRVFWGGGRQWDWQWLSQLDPNLHLLTPGPALHPVFRLPQRALLHWNASSNSSRLRLTTLLSGIDRGNEYLPLGSGFLESLGGGVRWQESCRSFFLCQLEPIVVNFQFLETHQNLVVSLVLDPVYNIKECFPVPRQLVCNSW